MNVTPDTIQRLHNTVRVLDGTQAPTEQAFLTYGEVLGSAVAGLRKSGGALNALTARLTGDEARTATRQLDQALRQVAQLATRQGGGDSLLAGLAGKADLIATQVSMLRKTVEEVGVLAMNAKIQASHLNQAGSDFGVFTVEIARLGNLAQATIDQASARLVQLRQLIRDARGQSGDFERRSAGELAKVHERLQEGLRAMAAHHDNAATLAGRLAEQSGTVAGRIGAAIGEMQINDIAAQRIAHVSEALKIIIDLQAGENMTRSDRQWLANLGEERGRALSGAVLRLQSMQLSRTRDEFCQRVDLLGHALQGLAQDARELSAMAGGAFTGTDLHGASFMGEVERDLSTARALLRQMEESRAEVRRLVETTVSDFASMASDLRNIQSIDADMRVMGLNATLKCGRLGAQGRALGVIAQELRGCSKRTEELARRLSNTLGEAMAMANDLTSSANTGEEDVGRAADVAMDSSLRTLTELGGEIEVAVRTLRTEVDRVAEALGANAAKMDIGTRLGSVLTGAIRDIDALAAHIDPEESDPRHVRHEVEQLLRGHYTMDSERLIHGLFAEEMDSPCMPAPAPVQAAIDDFDDCFL